MPPTPATDLQSFIDLYPHLIAALDDAGTVVAANAAWRQSARDGEWPPTGDVGDNFFAVCASTAGKAAQAAQDSAAAVRAVIAGDSPDGEIEYAHPDPAGTTWYRLRINRMEASGGLRVILNYEDTSEQKKQELQARDLDEKNTLLEAIQSISRIALRSLDANEILDVLSRKVIETSLFRSLTVGLVRPQRHSIDIVRSLRREPDGSIIREEHLHGLAIDLDDDDIFAEVARNGAFEAIEGWDEKRFTPRDHTGRDFADKVSYFIPVKKEDRVIAVLATGSTGAEKEGMLYRIQSLVPLIQHVAIALDHAQLYDSIQRVFDQQTQAYGLYRAEAAIRLRIGSMDAPEDIDAVAAEIKTQLRQAGVDLDDCTIQLVNAQGTDFFTFHSHNLRGSPLWTEGRAWTKASDNAKTFPWVIEAWQSGKSHYIPSMGEGTGLTVGMSVVDAPFVYGTLAINRHKAEAFDPGAIAALERFAHVLSEGFQRFFDLIERQKNSEGLQQVHQQLEDRVEMRTRQLTHINEQLQAEIAERKTRETHLFALLKVRDAVWRMERVDEFEHLVDTVQQSLDQVGIAYEAFGINLVDSSTDPPQWRFFNSRDAGWEDEIPARAGEVLTGIWRDNEVAYRRDLRRDDPYGEDIYMAEAFGRAARAVLDIPFHYGTLAVSSGEPDAFTGRDIDFLRELTGVLTTGLRRLDDIRALEDRNRALEDQQRLLQVFREIGEMTLSSLDQEQVLDNLGHQLVGTGIFRSLAITLVSPDGDSVEIARGFNRRFEEKSPVPGQIDTAISTHTVGFRYAIDSGNINALTARSGQVQIVEAWDDRLDPRIDPPDRPFDKVAYFIPVKKEDRVLAVLATASEPADKADMLLKIDQMQPLLNAVAIALEHSRLYEELQDRERQLYQSQKLEAVGQLTAGLAHNFNNALAGATVNLFNARREAPEPIHPFLQEAEHALLQAGEMVRQLLTYSRRDKGLSLHPLAVAPLIERIAGICRRTFDRKIDIQVAPAAALPPVRGDATQLEQMLLNLCLNARDALADQATAPTIHIATDCKTMDDVRYVRIQVTDNGLGMDEETRSQVFDPFFTTKPVDQGTGLGLSTVYGIAKQHGGWVECASAPGQGATFSVYIPTADREPETETEDAGTDLPLAGTETILFIDDDAIMRAGMAYLLEQKGYEVLIGADGQEGLDLFKRHSGRIDLVVLDLSMPKLSGQEVLVEMVQIDPAVKVVVFTGYAPQNAFYEKTVAAIVEKPLRPDDFLRTVRDVLDT